MGADRLIAAAQIEAAGGEPIPFTAAELFDRLNDISARVVNLERKIEALRK